MTKKIEPILPDFSKITSDAELTDFLVNARINKLFLDEYFISKIQELEETPQSYEISDENLDLIETFVSVYKRYHTSKEKVESHKKWFKTQSLTSILTQAFIFIEFYRLDNQYFGTIDSEDSFTDDEELMFFYKTLLLLIAYVNKINPESRTKSMNSVERESAFWKIIKNIKSDANIEPFVEIYEIFTVHVRDIYFVNEFSKGQNTVYTGEGLMLEADDYPAEYFDDSSKLKKFIDVKFRILKNFYDQYANTIVYKGGNPEYIGKSQIEQDIYCGYLADDGILRDFGFSQDLKYKGKIINFGLAFPILTTTYGSNLLHYHKNFDLSNFDPDLMIKSIVNAMDKGREEGANRDLIRFEGIKALWSLIVDFYAKKLDEEELEAFKTAWENTLPVLVPDMRDFTIDEIENAPLNECFPVMLNGSKVFFTTTQAPEEILIFSYLNRFFELNTLEESEMVKVSNETMSIIYELIKYSFEREEHENCFVDCNLNYVDEKQDSSEFSLKGSILYDIDLVVYIDGKWLFLDYVFTGFYPSSRRDYSKSNHDATGKRLEIAKEQILSDPEKFISIFESSEIAFELPSEENSYFWILSSSFEGDLEYFNGFQKISFFEFKMMMLGLHELTLMSLERNTNLKLEELYHCGIIYDGGKPSIPKLIEYFNTKWLWRYALQNDTYRENLKDSGLYIDLFPNDLEEDDFQITFENKEVQEEATYVSVVEENETP